jgi:hypothetical protein
MVKARILSIGHPVIRSLFIALVFGVTVLFVTWPLALHLNEALPLGTEQESTVPLFNTWTLWWVADRAGHGFEHFWQASIFYPSEGTFTFSEPQPLTGLLVLVLWNLFDSPMAIYNLAVLLCLFLNGVFAYRLGRALQIPPVPALLGGMLMIGLPITQKLLGVLPLIPVFGMLWALEGFVRFGRNGSLRMAAWAGVGLLVQLFTSQQLALLFGLFALPAGILALSQQGFAPSAILKLGSMGLAVIFLTGWYAWYPFQLHQSLTFTRSDNLVAALSAHPADYFSKPLSASIALPQKEDKNTDTGGLFPGFGLMLLAAWGAVSGLRQAETRKWTWYFLGTGFCAFILSLGIHSPIDEGAVLALLRDWVPGFHELRSPFRFAILVQISLVLLGLHGLTSQSRLPRFPVNMLAMWLMGMLALAENFSLPQPLATLPQPFPPPWTTWIQSHEGSRIVGHVPFPAGLHVSDYQIETERMLAQTIHRKRLVNGYSGYFPPGYDRFQLDMAKNFPSSFLLCFLGNELKMDTLIIDLPWYNNHQNEMAQFKELSRIIYRDEDVVIIDFPNIGGRCRREEKMPDGL